MNQHAGKLTIYMLNRKAELGKPKAFGGAANGRPPEQDIPLKVRCVLRSYVGVVRVHTPLGYVCAPTPKRVRVHRRDKGEKR